MSIFLFHSDAANKLILFTRSSSLVDELSLQLTKQSQEMDLTYISEIVFSDPQKVILSNLSAIQSQSKVQEILKTFVHSSAKKILFLVANMQVRISTIMISYHFTHFHRILQKI